jgi:hypothetical protein
MAPRSFGGWFCDDCGALNDSCDATCECERTTEEDNAMRKTVEITRPSGVIEVDFYGSPMQAAIMVVRHYRDATEAWTCIDGKRIDRIWNTRSC